MYANLLFRRSVVCCEDPLSQQSYSLIMRPGGQAATTLACSLAAEFNFMALASFFAPGRASVGDPTAGNRYSAGNKPRGPAADKMESTLSRTDTYFLNSNLWVYGILARNPTLMASLDIRSEWHCLDCKNYLVDGRGGDLSISSRPNVSSSIG
ncbi:25-hydroxycholesterol 7-alpha-hydroxylase [Fusarium oxysporum f. sp. albedinis]|nr:25-hydroxycholesterol 7-alpha-hydroxylase [Fusarium oxysporum f. sp. albedinis]